MTDRAPQRTLRGIAAGVRLRSAPAGTAMLALFVLSLTACDSGGPAFDDTARIAAVEQCRQVSEGAGIAGPAVTRVCNCAADKWLDKPVADRLQLDRATIQSIINGCAGTDRGSATAQSTETY